MVLYDEPPRAIFAITSIEVWGGFIYTVIGGSIFGHGLWAWLIKYKNISLISPLLLAVPVLTIALGAVIFNNIITTEFLLITSIIIFGIFLIFIAKPVTNSSIHPQAPAKEIKR